MECKYQLGTLCKAYAESKRHDDLCWAHYPECNNENCPLKHPELLEGAVLKEEGK